MICITLYNEPFERLLDSFAGIIRSVVEMQQISKSRFKDSIAVAVIADGYESLDENFLVSAENMHLIDRRNMLEYYQLEQQDEADPVPHVTNSLKSMTRIQPDIEDRE